MLPTANMLIMMATSNQAVSILHIDVLGAMDENSVLPTVSFASIFNLRFLHGLPLNVGGSVSATTFEWHDMIDDVSLSPFRVAGPSHEVGSCRGAALDLPVLVTFSNCRFLRS